MAPSMASSRRRAKAVPSATVDPSAAVEGPAASTSRSSATLRRVWLCRQPTAAPSWGCARRRRARPAVRASACAIDPWFFGARGLGDGGVAACACDGGSSLCRVVVSRRFGNREVGGGAAHKEAAGRGPFRKSVGGRFRIGCVSASGLDGNRRLVSAGFSQGPISNNSFCTSANPRIIRRHHHHRLNPNATAAAIRRVFGLRARSPSSSEEELGFRLVRCRRTTRWRSRTWSGTRSSGRTRTRAPAATSSRSLSPTSGWARRSRGARPAHSSSPSSTTPRTSPTPRNRRTSRPQPPSPSPEAALAGRDGYWNQVHQGKE